MSRLTYEYAIEVLNDYLGPLQPMLADPDVQEIMVNRADTIFVERNGIISFVAGCDLNPDALDRAITILANVNAKAQTPLLDARLPGLRLAAARQPVAIHGDMLSIRKHARRRIGLADYVRSGALDVLPAAQRAFSPRRNAALLDRLSGGGAALCEFFQWVMRERINVAFSGGTSSGKTTLLNAMIDAMPASDRIVTIEDTAELQVHAPNHVGLEANLGITIRDLVRFSLRIRPDRIIVGEVRGAEAFDLMEALNTGHPGSIVSFHADSADTAPARLESLIRMSDEGRLMSIADLRQKIASTFRFFVHAERQGAIRGPVEIREVLGVEHDRYRTRCLFSRYADVEEAAHA
ncbi:Flp pilus assembly CpaF family ATPase [Paraburkholderia sp. BL23I1N1]|uniref:CpaF family protein n=1 Tax=unclassified Paraburkholderia TaxID=2615204 RepID=UPI000A639F02|nr:MULTISPECIES: ATPase, T2SS/T4P/T4SS family [unclassified Paraburkholderia]REE18631.1 Flp pilus assembly CpaF family ATPase [Paraburkholderia sp. BL27I4N3]RKE35645.1 Flp pilus assembly CpaF family ATPase [Paraburkholderia sp. BL23I1N1]